MENNNLERREGGQEDKKEMENQKESHEEVVPCKRRKDMGIF